MMSKLIKLVFSLFGLISVCVGQIVQEGQCDDNLPVQDNFDIAQFSGQWFETGRFANPNQEGDCATYDFTISNDDINVNYTAVNSNFLEEAIGTITQEGNSAKLKMTIPSFDKPIDFWIREVLYTVYAFAYSCVNVSQTHRKVHVWVLGRSQTLSYMAIGRVGTILDELFGLSYSDLTMVNHSDEACYVLPIIEPGKPIVLPGKCDEKLQVLQNFDAAKFSGLWHQIFSYETSNSEGGCVRAEYTLDNKGVNILNSQVVNHTLLTIEGSATVISDDNSAKLRVVLNTPGASFTEQDLWILASDYENYAVLYTCMDIINSEEKRIFSWILGRNRQLSPAVETAVDQVVNSYIELNYQYYKRTDQSFEGCLFYPEVNDQPVVFRGQCESVNVQAMDDFELNLYMGRWHNIKSYPTRFQTGTCVNAYYKLADNGVNVLNSQVNNERLETISGVATPSSDDGSAKLVVSFPIAGSNQTTSTDNWVLDTDYRNFALVYSCQNVNDDEMRVSSWILSRTKSLRKEDEQRINETINSVIVLNEQYYKSEDQSTDGCFYFPDPQPDVPVIFPGQCDETINVVQSFNFQLFQGEWFEVESYPNDQQSGHCRNHKLSVLDNSRLNLEFSSITDQFLEVTSGVVTQSSTNDGKLSIAVNNISGEVTNIPFWILDIQYDDYALAYSCVNIDSDFRSVRSWKLSRTRQLSATANVAINQIINNNIVLSNDYFTHIDHSDEACFYLPEIEAGEPIILPGQCDTTIKGIPDFKIKEYIGRWRLIESYGSEFQGGTCNVAQYALLTENSINVIHTQVVNETLQNITGTATVASTDGSGHLKFSFSNNENFDYYILATDYSSYALGYSCVNLANNQRRIYSWKLSRDNTLSPDAVIKINKVIDTVQVLNNRYYYHVDRTAASCFYYPIPNPNSSVKFRGQCDQNIQVHKNFQIERYLGVWYDIQSYPSEFQTGTCNTANYGPGNNGVLVYNTQVINQALVSISGNAVLEPSNDGSAKLKVTFNVAGTDVTTDYWILDTDYRSYSLVYSCRPIDDEYVQVTSWKLSREKNLTPEAEDEINKVMNGIQVLDQRYFVHRNQTSEGCFYFPEPQPGVPVVFPGQCDDNIAAVPNFNISNFAGTWHEITVYPKDNQPGQCISQQFTVTNTTTMRLESFSVLDQFQSSTEGVVTVASTDGSGRLNINIQTNGQTVSIPYWILSIDYNDYALAYSCVNMNRDYRQVWSWKLSRSRVLSSAGNTAINNAITNIDVIDNRYFEDIDQSDAACFHLPDIPPGEDVVLPGQCDTTIRGIDNFNITKYAGQWRLIESYGSRFQSGTCNVAEYILQSSNTLGVTNSQVVNELLATISGTATISSTDGTGQLTFNLRNRVYDMLVLDTDYRTYALTYGCEDIDSDRRRVRSWKFSRSNTLSEDATNKITEVIERIEVLHQPYYYHVDRSPEACFYFPEPGISSKVVFRGQCDQNIRVVQDFNVTKYMGIWHDVQSYPSTFQDGTCSNARYTFTGDTVSVHNTHVVDQALVTIDGVATLPSTAGSGKLKVTFNVQNTEVSRDYWVLETNYESYALVYSCTNIDDDYMSVSSWKLSREKVLSPEDDTAIDIAMNDIKVLDQRYFVHRDQTPEGCFYFPEPQPGVPVVFPGQCDDNIAAVPNFNISNFAGTWHEITAYPKDNQPGQCISQQFTVTNTTTMRLESFSVLDQFQSSTEGVVTVASTDGSGRLNINIQTNGQTVSIPYWILSIDYNDYALAYSCVNMNKDYRQVWSWKLSRSRVLSSAGNTAINNAITNIDVIDNRYFEDIDQSDAACFHLPDIPPGEDVVLPGQCDTTIRGIDNFNITKYAGQWRLIESYGSRFQSGTCNVAEYILQSSNTLGVTNSQVVNELLATISGTASISSTDGTGQLTFNLRNRVYDMLVLDTDYRTYALTYGCEDIDSDRRRVRSWKFSRSNTLSEDATNKITEVIERIEVLHQPYYYHVDRSPEACFYFPEPGISSNVVFRGQCDQNIRVVQDFNVTKYMGIWHDVQSYPSTFQDGTCSNARYTFTGDTVSVHNTHVVDQALVTIDGVATLPSTAGSGKLKVTFNVQNTEVSRDYWVLETNYESYALVYSCTNIDDDYISVSSWKLSREKVLSPEDETAIDIAMNDIKVLDQRYFVHRDQTPEGCFYFPEPQPGVPVVFPGQCDDNIAAVPNFNISNFAGTWHEITAYPKDNQPGQCISQQFTVTNTTTMRLESFSVLDQFQSSTEGVVTVASTDGSGRLHINIQTNGQTVSIPFWILSIDYNDYALAYSCVNLNRDYRQVWSWKLSRSRVLSSAGNTAINNAITNIDVIDNRYFEVIDQSDAACFHYPELGPNDPVVFPGKCDLNIPVIQNFDVSRYLGRWRLLESYYSEFQEGTCNAAHYAASSNGTLIVTNSKVVDEELKSIVGSAVPLASDGSGKLVVTFPDGTPSEYWILATDYETFALVYTCMDLPDNERRVWSWKMSRSNTLSPNAIIEINNAINNIDVLDERYYQKIDRTDTGCFYYPIPDNNFDVIFPGQCDDSIEAVPDFQLEKYAGTWFDVESYPTSFQSGTCNTAHYTLNANGTLQVTNTQVSGQVLQTTTGVAVPTTNDGSGKFDVTLTQSNGNVITTKYWVLATDYNTYSLVYSCRNIDDEFRAVYSWKLGRNNTLNATAQADINDKLDEVQVLEQKYYVERKHTEDDCFYYPDNKGGDVILNGQCDDALVPAVTNFNPALFNGTWHEVARFPSGLQNGECGATEFVLVDGNFDIVQTSVVDEAQLSTVTRGTLATDGRGVISLNIDGVPFNNVYILLTDNSEYALAYSCRNLDAEKKQIYSWKLSRSRAGLSHIAHLAIQEHVSSNIDLFEGYYRTTKQDNSACFYYPVFDQLPLSIELPGPCNASITGIPNFNANDFAGQWLEVARYPQPIQTGQCSRVEYTNNGDDISVVSTQVLNEKLQTTPGNAVIASTDGTGVLEVSLGEGDASIQAKLYVLATDYTNYALLYNCINLVNGNRRVGSWKLSKSGSLSSQENDAIDEVISKTQGLTNDYYLNTDQSDEACFHYPEPSEKEVILPGQCDNTISGVTSFDMDKFKGTWYQIERYDAVRTSCIGIRLTYHSESNEFAVLSYEVSDGDLSTDKGTGRLVSTDGTGKLSLVMAEEDLETTILILSTDYNSYAVAYSCSNIGGSQRRVRIWQLSRERTMSSAGVTAVTDLTEQRKEFHQPYFKSIPHDEECPEPSSGYLFKSSIIVIFVCAVLQLVMS